MKTMRRILATLISLCCFFGSSTAQDRSGSLTGTVQTAGDAIVPGVSVELVSETMPGFKRNTEADSHGIFRLYDLPAGQYELRLRRPGFQNLTIKSLRLGSGELSELPPVRMKISGSCGPGPVLDSIEFLGSGVHSGEIEGSVRRLTVPFSEDSPPVPAAKVALICADQTKCAETSTGADGRFFFIDVLPRDYSVQVSGAGFYPEAEPDYDVQSGIKSLYWPIYVEPCYRKNCDTKRRPKKPLVVCE